MTQSPLPDRTIVVIEDETSLREELIRDMEQAVPGNKVRGFPDGNAGVDWLLSASTCQNSELILVVADSVGLSFMKEVGKGRRMYHGARKIMYSGKASDANVAEWKKSGLIDCHVSKGYPALLMKQVDQFIREYDQEEVLADIRSYIDNECSNPHLPYYTSDDGRVLSIVDLYHEILKGTAVGMEAADEWMGMRKAEKVKQ